MKRLFILLFIFTWVLCSCTPSLEKSATLELPDIGKIDLYTYKDENGNRIKIARFKDCGAGISTSYHSNKTTRHTITLYEDDNVVVYKKEK